MMTLAVSASAAQQAEARWKAEKPIQAGCNLETGPETFQLITSRGETRHSIHGLAK